jgi:hypothetical protein
MKSKKKGGGVARRALVTDRIGDKGETQIVIRRSPDSDARHITAAAVHVGAKRELGVPSRCSKRREPMTAGEDNERKVPHSKVNKQEYRLCSKGRKPVTGGEFKSEQQRSVIRQPPFPRAIIPVAEAAVGVK